MVRIWLYFDVHITVLFLNERQFKATKSLNFLILLVLCIQAAWNFYESKSNTSDSFSKEEQESWNAQKKAATDKAKDQQ